MNLASRIGIATLTFGTAGLAPATPLPGQIPGEPSVPEILAEVRLHVDGTSELSIVVPTEATVPEKLRLRIEAGDGVRTETAEESHLNWTAIPVSTALALVIEAQDGTPEPLNVRILMAPGAAFDDMWDVQYTLTQGGVRQVRFVSGDL